MGDVFLSIFVISILGIFVILVRKIPALMRIPFESIENRETFFQFLKRKIIELPNIISKVYHLFLSILEKHLHRAKIRSLKMHNMFDAWKTSVKDKKEVVSDTIEQRKNGTSEEHLPE